MPRTANRGRVVAGAVLLASLSLVLVCNRHRIADLFKTSFDDVSIIDGKILEDGDPVSGTLEARNQDVHTLAAQLFAGSTLDRWIDIPTQGLILELPVEDGLAQGQAVLFVDVEALASGDLLAFEGYKLTAAQWASARLKVATAAFVAGKLHGPVEVWKPSTADLELHKIAEATFADNLPHGIVRLYYEGADQVQREFVFEHGVEAGARRRLYASGQLQGEAMYVAGRRHGDDTAYFRDGTTRSRATFVDGVPQREEAWFPGGAKRSEIEFADGIPTTARHWYSNGSLARTVDANGAERVFPAQGIVQEFYADGSLRSEQGFVEGVADGPFRRYYADETQWEEGSYRSGARHGDHKKWWKNGTLALESRWDNGVLEGGYARWYASGDRWERATYVAGKRMGRYQKWWKNGTVASDHTYTERGLQGDFVTYYDNGATWAKGVYRDGRVVGTMKRWFPDGKLGFEQAHANGRPHGVFNRWYPDGSPRLKAAYVDGKLHGEFTNWLEDGSVLESATYDHGTPTLSEPVTEP